MKKTGVKHITSLTAQVKDKGDLHLGNSDHISAASFLPDTKIEFEVSHWHTGTTELEKKKDVTWRVYTQDRKIVLSQKTIKHNEKFSFLFKKKFCGIYCFYITASTTEVFDIKDVGWLIRGYLKRDLKQILNISWSTKQKAIFEKEKHVFSFGETIFLKIDTVGLNGHLVKVLIYNKNFTGKKYVRAYEKVEVINGEVNLKITDSTIWKKELMYLPLEHKKDFSIDIVETFYQLGDKNTSTNPDVNSFDVKTIKYDYKNQTPEYNKYVEIKDNVIENKDGIPTNLTPLIVGKPDKNAERYEPCKFEAITIKEKLKKEDKEIENKVVVFDKGKKPKNVTFPSDEVNTSVFFDIGSKDPDSKGKLILQSALRFLLEHEHSKISLSGYACTIGTVESNLKLSTNRADVVRKYFTDGGLDTNRISSKGWGEAEYRSGTITPKTDDSPYSNDASHRNEKNNENARRVIISYKYFGHNADTIVYEATAPSINTKKDLEIEITGYDTKSCFRQQDKHKKEIKVIEMHKSVKLNGYKVEASTEQETKTSPYEPNFKQKIYSNLPKEIKFHKEIKILNNVKVFDKEIKPFPMIYIWPKSIPPNEFNFHAHSCRYFTSNKNATLKALVYSDIAWSFEFSIGTSNVRNLYNKNLTVEQIKKLEKQREEEIKAGKKDTLLKASLKAKWENGSKDYDFSKEFEKKSAILYKLFAGIELLTKAILKKTGGELKIDLKTKGIPMAVSLVPPSFSLKTNWFLNHSKTNKQLLGTNVKIGVHADPLIGIALTIDLLGGLIILASGAVSGGTAAPGVGILYGKIQDMLKKGIDLGDDKKGVKGNVDIYMDLIITGTMHIGIDKEFNTADVDKNKAIEIYGSNRLKIELKIGFKVKGEAVIVVVKIDAFFEASGQAVTGIGFGSTITFDDDGLFYKPQLGFDGLSIDYVVKYGANASSKTKFPGSDFFKQKKEGTLAKGEFKDIIPKFDVFEVIAGVFGIKDTKIPLMRYKKDETN
jgi:outer membrane protein OmpA-like peptidoglycan-associated protein